MQRLVEVYCCNCGKLISSYGEEIKKGDNALPRQEYSMCPECAKKKK